MLSRIVLIPLVVAALCALVSSPLFAQSKEEGERLWKEAYELQEKAQSKEAQDRAVQKYEEALSIFRKVADPKSEGQTLNNLGIVYWKWGQYDKAKEYYEKDLAICRKLKDRLGEGHTLNNLGLVYKGSGQYDKAKECFEQSLAIKRKLKDCKGQGATLMNLGTVYWKLGRYGKAKEYFEKSFAMGCRDFV